MAIRVRDLPLAFAASGRDGIACVQSTYMRTRGGILLPRYGSEVRPVTSPEQTLGPRISASNLQPSPRLCPTAK